MMPFNITHSFLPLMLTGNGWQAYGLSSENMISLMYADICHCAWLAFGFTIAIVTTAMALTFSVLKKIRKEKHLRNQADHCDSLLRQLESLRAEHEALQKRTAQSSHTDPELMQLFRGKYDALSKLCSIIFDLEATAENEEGTQSIMVKELNKAIRSLGDEESLREMEEAENHYLDGIVARLRQECPNLTEENVTLAILSYAGFSPKAICLLMGKKSNSYYTYRERLKAKIRASNAPSQDWLISQLR